MSVYVGIDVHRKRSQVAVVTEEGKVCLNRNVVNGSGPMLRLIGGLPAGTPVASGAAFGWGWLAELPIFVLVLPRERRIWPDCSPGSTPWSNRIPNRCQIVVMVPWLDSRFVQASTAQACGVACAMARIAGETIESRPHASAEHGEGDAGHRPDGARLLRRAEQRACHHAGPRTDQAQEQKKQQGGGRVSPGDTEHHRPDQHDERRLHCRYQHSRDELAENDGPRADRRRQDPLEDAQAAALNHCGTPATAVRNTKSTSSVGALYSNPGGRVFWATATTCVARLTCGVLGASEAAR